MVIVVSIVFVVVCASLVALVHSGMRGPEAIARRRRANPTQPWLWRDDWATRRVREQSPRQSATIVFALMWCAIAFSLAYMRGWHFPNDPDAAISLLFAAIGVIFLGRAAYSMLRRRKFGRSICEIDRLPIEPGQTFSGTIEHRGAQTPDDGYQLVLSCLDRVVTRRVNRQRPQVDDTVLWNAEQRVSAALAAPSSAGMRVPFSFAIPADALPSQSRRTNERVLWQLAVSAELPGIDYNATFELPVFNPANSASSPAPARS